MWAKVVTSHDLVTTLQHFKDSKKVVTSRDSRPFCPGHDFFGIFILVMLNLYIIMLKSRVQVVTLCPPLLTKSVPDNTALVLPDRDKSQLAKLTGFKLRS